MALTAKKVYAILKRQISDMEAKLNSPVRYRGTVATADLLPLNPDIGDMYNIESKSVYGEAGMNVAWNGVVWDTMGAPIDMSLYIKSNELADWVKQQNKPTYTAEEVGALPDTTVIPSKTSDLQNDSGFLTKIPDNYLSGTDKTLSVSGQAADAKTVGDKNVELLANILSKLDKNQGSENFGKIAGINESGDIVPMFPVSVDYNEETNCLEFGSDQKMELNKGINLDSTLTKTGYAADAGAVGEITNSLKEDLGKLDESFIVEPNNYVDYSKVEKSKKLQHDSDELADSSTYDTTDYIRVKSGEKIFFATGETPQKIPFIKGFNNLKHGVSWDGSVDSYTVPENVTFVRASFYPIWLNYKFQICKGSIKPYSEYHDPYVSVKRNDISYDVRKNLKDNYITCWGDSLTQQGGWTDIISEFSGYPVFNSGIGGETAFTIMGRQGADNITVNNIIIPSDATPVVIGTYAEGGLDTVRGHKAFPLAKPNIVCMNPCSIGGILGNVNWTGTSNTDTNGTWTFTRLENGNKLIIDRPTSIITNYAKYNKGITIIWIGTNGGYGTESNLVDMNRKMIEHSGCENRYVVLGVCNNTSSALQGYETKMDNEFGSHFINIRKYLSTPIYESDGISLLSSYGLRDAGLEMTEQDKIDIQSGRIPSSLRADSTHFNNYGKSAVGKYIYKRMYELGLFN